ncbi:hypothetical protein ACSVH2_11260 [Flavobacterium sp. RSB2_4_14]|uniref:hypothetical protein n=1 Tax=Flavobacterium sp. RSB2_4_14 TaxID=3447665 RepID=UPI003F2D9B8B
MKKIIIFLLAFPIFCACNKKQVNKTGITKNQIVDKKVELREIFPDFIQLKETDFNQYEYGKNSKWFLNNTNKLYFIPYTDYSVTNIILTNRKLEDKNLIDLLNTEGVNISDSLNAIKIDKIETNKKISLGISKKYAEEVFGQPNFKKYNVLKWNFKMLDNDKNYINGYLKPFVLDDLGFNIEMNFDENDKLHTLIYSYDVP